MKSLFFIFTFLPILLLTSCANSSSNKQSKNAGIDGIYTYSDNSAKLTITIYGNSWNGKTIIISGIDSDYDAQNTQYDNGVVMGNDLYEKSGIAKIGYVNGKSLYTSVGGRSITLQKE